MNQFISKWRRLHHPSMDVSGDVAFFYQLYARLHAIIGQESRRYCESEILRLVLYTENIIAIGLDGVYEYRYRSVGDVVCHWCNKWQLPVNATSQINRLVNQAVADAPCSSLRRWMMESILSDNFQWLSGMLTYLAREDKVLRLALPDLRFRRAMFRQLTDNRQTARQMLWADIAFNWQDKRGFSLSAAIADRFRHSFPTINGQEQALLKEAADALATLRPERLDTYTVIERKGSPTLTLRHRNGRVFENVVLNEESDYLAAQLVTYLGKNYINGPAVWLDSKDVENWNGERIWTDIINKEQEAARQRHFITAFGKRICLYDDLYTIPADPDEARDAESGIYPDEPDILDFMEWLKPGEAVDKVFCFR